MGQHGRDLAAEFIGVADWHVRVYPAYRNRMMLRAPNARQ